MSSEHKTITLKIPVPRWPRVRFSVRTCLLLLLAASLGLGWWADRRRLEREIHDLRNPRRGWDTDQVLGRPDTPQAGDYRTAWASKTRDGQDEWLVLDYGRQITPTAVLVHETYNPGALVKVSAFDRAGKEIVVWEGTDPTPPTAGRGVSKIPVTAKIATSRIKLYLDSKAVPGWNEIDAVGLRDDWGRTYWAQRAWSSTSYGRNNELPESLIPGYQGVF